MSEIIKKLEDQNFIPFLSDFYSEVTTTPNKILKYANSKYNPHTAKNSAPYLYQFHLEDILYNLAKSHGLEVKAGKTKNKINFIEIHSGDFIFTQSAVANPGALVRDARFRETLAESNEPQGLLFPDIGSEGHARGNAFYGILLHNKINCSEEELFFQLAFPNQDCTDYLTVIDLKKQFEIKTIKSDTEIIEDKIDPKIKKTAIIKSS